MRELRDLVVEVTTRVVPDIGQIDHPSRLALNRMVRAGTIAKWRGRWAPEAGAPWGLGGLKTCYGPPEIRDYFASFETEHAKGTK